MVNAFRDRLTAFTRATLFSRPVADLPFHTRREDTSHHHPYKSEVQPPCKYDGHEISYHCDSW